MNHSPHKKTSVVGIALLKARTHRGMKQITLAGKTASTSPRISNIEHGYKPSFLRDLENYAEALNCDLLINFQPKEIPSPEEQISQLAQFLLTLYPAKENERTVNAAIRIIGELNWKVGNLQLAAGKEEVVRITNGSEFTDEVIIPQPPSQSLKDNAKEDESI